ncbi:MAG: hypothetical protein NTY35_00155 [Planctomycetota bacterium]|nr:hypothetical protein [Planctomycetota bacterium]
MVLPFLGVLLASLSMLQEGLPEHVLFDGRRLDRARFEGPPGTRTPRGLEFQGAGSRLATEVELGAGDTGVTARLALFDRGASGAALRIGDSVFGLDGEKSALFLDGPLFGNQFARLDDGAKWFATGKAFELSARRRGSDLVIAIDGKVAYQTTVGSQALGRVVLEPGKSRIVLERLALEGSIAQATPVARDDRLQAQVEASVRRGVDWLLAAQLRDGSWRHLQQGFRGGQTALCAYTLLRAGLPADHPSVQRAFLFLDRVQPGETYSAGLMTMAYEALRDPARRPRIEALARTIVAWQKGGQWGYPNNHEGLFERWLGDPSAPDLSNTQYAVLGLRAARHAGVESPEKIWNDIIDRTLTLQEELPAPTPETRKANRAGAAGFRYAIGREICLSMTAAGVSVLEIARQALGPKLRGERLALTERAIRSGVAWLDEHYTPEDNFGGSKTWHYYALYGVERVGTLLEIEEIGHRDWYAEGARWFLKSQSDDGSFGVGKPFGAGNHAASQEETDTCFAILFLRRASRPTVATSSSAWSPREQVDPTESVRFRASGEASTVLWIDGFSDGFVADNGGTLGLRVLRVDYMEGDRVLATRPGDPSRGFENENFAARYAFTAAGEHVLRAVVTYVDPLAPTGATSPEKRVESREVRLRTAGALEPWMREAAAARDRDLLLAAPPRASSSSVNGSETADKAFDGSEATRWVSASDDANPWLVMELGKGVKADTLVLGQGGAARDLAGRYDRIQSVEVRLNREKEPLTFSLSEDELSPSVLPLGKLAPISRVEIRVTKRVAGKDWKGRVALSEVALEKRGG